jgi:hypothetical protein
MVAIVIAIVGALGTIGAAAIQPWVADNLSTCHSVLPCPDGTPTPGLTGCAKPAVQLDPGDGPAGTQVVVRGCGFGADETVAITLGDDTVATAQADRAGSFSVPFAVPSSYRGRGPVELTVIARGQTSQLQNSATFALSLQ